MCAPVILNSEGSSGGADDFLPLFIYVVGHANLSKLYSNKEYIARYIDPSERFAEPYYYYTHLVSAMNYLEKLTPEKAKEVLKERELKDLETEKAKEIEQEKLDPEGAFLRSESELIAMTKAVKAAIESGTLGNEGDKALIANFIEMSEKLLPHFHSKRHVHTYTHAQMSY